METAEITFVLPGLRPLGGVRAVLEIADRLKDLGYRTEIVVPERTLLAPKRSLLGLAQRYGPRWASPWVQRFAPSRTIDVDWFPLRSPLRFTGPDLVADLPVTGAVIATSYRTAEEMLRFPQLKTRGVYFLQHYEAWSGPKRRVNATWRRFDHLIVTTPWMSRMAAGAFGHPDVPVAVYGVDHAAFAPRSKVRDDGPAVVGFMWDDRPFKGGATALAAFAALRTQGVDFTVRAYGLGDPGGLPRWIDFRGQLSGAPLADFYRELDLWVAPGHSESGPMSVPEAMVSGVAVVSTDTGNMRIWTQDGRWCVLVPPADPHALAREVGRLVADPVERARLAAGARKAIKPFTWEATAQSVEQALIAAGVLAGRAPRPDGDASPPPAR